MMVDVMQFSISLHYVFLVIDLQLLELFCRCLARAINVSLAVNTPLRPQKYMSPMHEYANVNTASITQRMKANILFA